MRLYYRHNPARKDIGQVSYILSVGAAQSRSFDRATNTINYVKMLALELFRECLLRL